MLSFSDMPGRTAIVTGATRGIGEAVSAALQMQGVKVFGLSLDAPTRAGSDSFIWIGCDLSKPTEIDRAAESIRARVDRIDYLVNVAGRDPKWSLEEGDAQRFDELLGLNIRAYYLLIRASLPLLRAGEGKSIVNISSINYRLGVPKRSIYSVSKAGILGLTTGLARELGAEGIRINTVTPGWVFTRRQRDEYFDDPEKGAGYLDYLRERQAIPRQITPADVANHILFYLSDASAASTGHNCIVDGGWLLE